MDRAHEVPCYGDPDPNRTHWEKWCKKCVFYKPIQMVRFDESSNVFFGLVLPVYYPAKDGDSSCILEAGRVIGGYSRNDGTLAYREASGRLHQEYRGSSMNREFFTEDGWMIDTANPQVAVASMFEPDCKTCKDLCMIRNDGEQECPKKIARTKEGWLPPKKEGLFQDTGGNWVCGWRVPTEFIYIKCRYPIIIRDTWLMRECIQEVVNKFPAEWKRKTLATNIKHNLGKLSKRTKEEYDNDPVTQRFIGGWLKKMGV